MTPCISLVVNTGGRHGGYDPLKSRSSSEFKNKSLEWILDSSFNINIQNIKMLYKTVCNHIMINYY